MVSPNICYVRNEQVVTRVIEGETIIVPMKQTVEDLTAIFTLNEMASVIWERIDGHTSVAELINSVYREYRVPAEKVIKDTVNLLVSFETAGLIHLEAAGKERTARLKMSILTPTPERGHSRDRPDEPNEESRRFCVGPAAGALRAEGAHSRNDRPYVALQSCLCPLLQQAASW